MKYYDKLIFELSSPGRSGFSLRADEFSNEGNYAGISECIPDNLLRGSAPDLPQVSEPDVVRHYTNLSQMNFGVDSGFYPLGSCTMKYNPKIDEEVASFPGFSGLHPLQGDDTVQGALQVYYDLDKALCSITGMAGFTFNPCAGAHGELTGLMVMRRYHQLNGEPGRNRVIIPDSAHGTNPASAAVCGLKVDVVKSGEDGLVDVESLRPLLGPDLAGIMLTNPNTLGLFETAIGEIAELVHGSGGLLYYDGANMNPLLGMVRPGDMGFDILHLNLHKTFATPHGGGGPGAGPVGVGERLLDILPLPRVRRSEEGSYYVDHENDSSTGEKSCGRVSGFMGNFAVMLRAYAYILSLGHEHLADAGRFATLSANYMKECLKGRYRLPIDRVCKHEFVLDGLIEGDVTTLDVAKRLLDYGFHAPTIYFPLLFHQSIMIEPTETESKESMDAFIEVMKKIADEAVSDPALLKSAPHNTPIGRPDETLAARHPELTYDDECNGKS